MQGPRPVRAAIELAAALKYEFYLVNGLRARPDPDALLQRAAGVPRAVGETERMVHLAGLRDTPFGAMLLRDVAAAESASGEEDGR